LGAVRYHLIGRSSLPGWVHYSFPYQNLTIPRGQLKEVARLGFQMDGRGDTESSSSTASGVADVIAASLLTGGVDKHYVFGLCEALLSKGAVLDLIGSDDLEFPEFRGQPGINFLNLRGSHETDASVVEKALRVLKYYVKLIRYAAAAKPKVFHILWNNKFQFFDRTLLMLYYRLLGKTIVLTVHNVNGNRRDFNDSHFNRFTLRIQYRLSHHFFVHTEKMKSELVEEFGVREARVSVIPYGINNAVPNTRLTSAEARELLGFGEDKKILLFFGNIKPYKGVEDLIVAFQRFLTGREGYRLIIAGRTDRFEQYGDVIREAVLDDVQRGEVMLRDEFIPDNDAELFFKAADVLILPYRHIYQSGVLFLGYSFGLPALAADVGSLKEEIIEGETGFVFKPADPIDLARTIERYFASELFANLNIRRRKISQRANEQHSWDLVGQTTMKVYAGLLQVPFSAKDVNREISSGSLDVNAPS
jgi:D-inositol-3-phosphate glycosyltransferase